MQNRNVILTGIGIGIGIAFAFLIVFFLIFTFEHKRLSFFPFWERRPMMGQAHMMRPNHSRHGIVGTIDSTSTNNLVINDRSGSKITVVIDDNTIIKQNNTFRKLSDLKKDEQVVIIGQPQQNNTVLARIINVVLNFQKEATISARPYMFPGFRGGLR